MRFQTQFCPVKGKLCRYQRTSNPWPQTNDSLDGRPSAKMDKLCREPYGVSSILKWVKEKLNNEADKIIMNSFEWKTRFVWRVTYICGHVTQAQILPTSLKHVSICVAFLGLGKSWMSLRTATNIVIGGSINSDISAHTKRDSRWSEMW